MQYRYHEATVKKIRQDHVRMSYHGCVVRLNDQRRLL